MMPQFVLYMYMQYITLELLLTDEAKQTGEFFRPITTARVLGGARILGKALKRPQEPVLVC